MTTKLMQGLSFRRSGKTPVVDGGRGVYAGTLIASSMAGDS
ncbi:hypothetical protein J2741_000151 [Methanolinea mesophila]|nr:hypothetical protein [Methanolinea mesophila]MBP1927604.1 hypothetical protein [Methanolinea mesophila]